MEEYDLTSKFWVKDFAIVLLLVVAFILRPLNS